MENQIVRKANHLIEASYKLSTIEQKIILFLASTLKSDDEDFKSYPLKIKAFQNYIGNSSVHYERMEDMILSLKEKNLKISYLNKNGRKMILNVSWISSSEYEEGSGVVHLCFDPKLKPFLLQLKSSFTNYRLKNIVQLKSQFSIRIYELLKQYEKLGKRLFEVSELREILGIDEDQYRQYTDFRKRVILVAQLELAEKTDLSFEFEELKMGHSVGQIRFIIKSKPHEKVKITEAETVQEIYVSQENSELDKLIALLPKDSQGLDSIKKMLKSWLEKQTFDYVARNIEYANDRSNAVKPGVSQGKGSNYRVYLSKALTGDFGLPHKEDKETKKKAEAEIKRKAQEEAHTKKQRQAQVNKEKEDQEKARTFQQSLSHEDLEQLKAEALSRLPPEQQTLVKRKALGSEITMKFMMNKISLERMKVS